MGRVADFTSVEMIQTKRYDELSPEEEDMFYKKVFKTKLL